MIRRLIRKYLIKRLLKGPKPGKFGNQYTGPHKVLEILNRNNIEIRIKKNS